MTLQEEAKAIQEDKIHAQAVKLMSGMLIDLEEANERVVRAKAQIADLERDPVAYFKKNPYYDNGR